MRQRKDEDFHEEIEAHLQLEIDQLVEEGLSPREAELQARRTFGNVTRSKETFYESNRVLWLDDFKRNVSYAFRQMKGTPVSTAAILLSLALGVGLNTSIFSIADQALVRTLPVEDPKSLVQLQWDGNFVVSGMGSVGYGHLIPYPLYERLREEEMFDDLFARTGARVHLATAENPMPSAIEFVSGTYFSGLGVTPSLGRLLSVDDDVKPGGHPVAVLSYAFWKSHFGGRETALGEQIRVNDEPFTVVGVAAPNFKGTDWSLAPAAWVPMMMREPITGWSGLDEPRSRFAHVFGRMSETLTSEQLEARLEPWFDRYLEADMKRSDWPSVTEEQRTGFVESKLRILPGAHGQAITADRMAAPITILSVATGLVFLLACLNVANLSLARAFESRRATALRTALGASRKRILGESFVESGVLALVGGGLGVLIAPFVSRFALGLLDDSATASLSSHLDLRVLAFAFLITTTITLIAGTAPALFAASTKPASALRQRGTGGGAGLRLRKCLVVAQFVLALVLLIGASLFSQTLSSLRGEGPGYSTSNLLALSIAPTKDGFSSEESKALARRLQQRLEALPEVSAVGLSKFEMLVGGGWNNPVTVNLEGQRIASDLIAMNAVSPGFFETLGTSIRVGRDFNEQDSLESDFRLRSAIVNQQFVDRYLDGRSPIGGHLAFGIAPDVEPAIEIVGVVQTFKDFALREARPQVFFPLWEGSVGRASVYLRTTTSTVQASESIRSALVELEPNLTIASLHTIDDQMDRMLANERILAGLAGAFAVVATLLAMIGLYGVLRFSADRRRNEMGIRIALGANRWEAGGLLVKESMTLTGAGLAIALPGVWAAGRLIESQLFGVTPMDLMTVGTSIVVLLTVALLASWQPAHRLSRTDPLEALKVE